MKIYIAGKITGLPIGKVIVKFDNAEFILRYKYRDAEIINPIKLAMELERRRTGNLDNFPSLERHQYLAYSIKHLLDCTHIYLIEDWKDSEGAKLEVELCRYFGIHIL